MTIVRSANVAVTAKPIQTLVEIVALTLKFYRRESCKSKELQSANHATERRFYIRPPVDDRIADSGPISWVKTPHNTRFDLARRQLISFSMELIKMIVSLFILLGFALAVIGAEPDPAPARRTAAAMTTASKIKLRANPTLRELTIQPAEKAEKPAALVLDKPQALLD
jgi:hypothetical protein